MASQVVGVDPNVTLDSLEQNRQMKDLVFSGGSSGVGVWEVDDKEVSFDRVAGEDTGI
jgi:hypothetical protein